MEKDRDYKDWSHESLVERVTQLEQQLREKNLRFDAHRSLSGAVSDGIIGVRRRHLRKRREVGQNEYLTLQCTQLD
jgi:hypothetical protein